MRPITMLVVGAATSVPIVLDQYLTPFNVSLTVSAPSGAIVATVQYTNDDVFAAGYNPALGQWFDHADLTAVVALSAGTLISPVSAVRLVNAGAGTAQLIVRQAGAA